MTVFITDVRYGSFEETGAIVASLTTSIREAPNSGRTWDYRYCWLRDAYFVVQALNQLGATLTMEDFLYYIINIGALGKDRRRHCMHHANEMVTNKC